MDRKYILVVVCLIFGFASSRAAESPATAHFRERVQPVLREYCFDCHADGANKGGIAFDEFKSDDSLLGNHTLWLEVLKNIRSGIMPPAKKPRPSPEERKRLEDWIKYDAFGIDPKNPAAGRVTIRRLNRVEYHNTIRDLTGVEYDTQEEFPPDDTGYGFDDIGDVLTLSPMLFEKYVDAAKTIIMKRVPLTSRVPAEKVIAGRAFHGAASEGAKKNESGPTWLSYYKKQSITNLFHAEYAGNYQLVVNLAGNEHYVEDAFDYNKCRLVFKADGREFLRKEYIRQGDQQFHYECAANLSAGDHELVFELEPLTPDEKQVRDLTIRIDAVTMRGPMEEKYWVPPSGYNRFFTRDVPESASARRAYARELLGWFATKAFRRPVDDATVKRLVSLAEGIYQQPGKTFESGIAEAMVAVLASPRFIFRIEEVEPHSPAGTQPLIDEYALASRLSYFLWSSMPDDELFGLAHDGRLRANQAAQVKRMLEDQRSEALVKNFTGQWLQARDIETVPIDSKAVLAREVKEDPDAEKRRARFRELAKTPEEKLTPEDKKELETLRAKINKENHQAELSDDLRRDMRRETEMYFANIIHADRSVIELVESDYTYLNENYGLTNLNVTGSEMRQVKLPADSARGGVITMGTVLAVTSNPTRTSPVKRGLFILENILGNPTPPPPPNIPPLEDAEKGMANHEPTLREILAIHRGKPLCNSCHSRMDPLGLALENFNALGMWRNTEHDQPIDPSGKLITGEPFQNVRELKHILATDHRADFYRTLTEKMLTYALGRGLEYYDVETVDEIVNRLQQADGHFSALLSGIIESNPFQKRQNDAMLAQSEPPRHGPERRDVANKR